MIHRYVVVITSDDTPAPVEPFHEREDGHRVDKLLDLLLDGAQVQSIAEVAAVDVQF